MFSMPLDAPEPTIFELDHAGEERGWFAAPDADEKSIDEILPSEHLTPEPPEIPDLSEPEVVRHFTRLSRMNFSVDSGFYPLGSCTMKYNPKINEALAQLPGFLRLHPEVADECAQGTLRLMDESARFLAELMGVAQVTLNPCAGAHGELCGMLMVRAYHRDRGQSRSIVLIPDSAHGTNPASAAMAGFETIEIRSNSDGCVDLDDLRRKLSEDVAALMLTNPNTLGLFEEDILKIARHVHDAGALLYYDGANLNAIAGIARPGDMGFDVVHLNLHKTFSTPHGGGGPGSGPVGVCEKLVPYLPIPVIEKNGQMYTLSYDCEKSIGQISTFYGNVGVVLRAYVYLRIHGLEGLRKNSIYAVLNARYLKKRLEEFIPPAVPGDPLHEFVLTMKDKEHFGDLTAMALAKNLLDHGFHAPTVYFPLIVKEALMIEPTETESQQTLDAFTETIAAIIRKYEQNPQYVLDAPHTTPVRRLDEVTAARKPNLAYSR